MLSMFSQFNLVVGNLNKLLTKNISASVEGGGKTSMINHEKLTHSLTYYFI